MRTLVFSILYEYTLRFIFWTSRLIYIGEEKLPKRPFIYIFWHNNILFTSYTHRGRLIHVLVSTSKDGNISRNINSRFGHRIIRGTTSNPRDAQKAMIGLLKCLKKGGVVALTPDGPKGPVYEVKKGIPYLAQKLNCPIVPVSCTARKKIISNSWDKLIIPLPFNKIVCMTGDPIYIDKDEKLEIASERIKKALLELGEKAETSL